MYMSLSIIIIIIFLSVKLEVKQPSGRENMGRAAGQTWVEILGDLLQFLLLLLLNASG